MVERLWKFGCGISSIFGGAAGYGAASALFQKVLSVMLFFGAIVFCAVMLAQAAAEDRAERPIAEDVRRVKIKERPWVRKYYDGEFDPEDDPSQSASQTALPKGRAYETASAASKIKKFVL